MYFVFDSTALVRCTMAYMYFHINWVILFIYTESKYFVHLARYITRSRIYRDILSRNLVFNTSTRDLVSDVYIWYWWILFEKQRKHLMLWNIINFTHVQNTVRIHSFTWLFSGYKVLCYCFKFKTVLFTWTRLSLYIKLINKQNGWK